MAKLIVLRGLPDSNKDELVYDNYKDCIHLEADMYFMHDGKYMYDHGKIKQAHDWCQRTVKSRLADGINVVVTNTFVRRWEISPYVKIAHEFNADIEIVTATGKGQNKTNVPQSVIDRMRKNWEAFDLYFANNTA